MTGSGQHKRVCGRTVCSVAVAIAHTPYNFYNKPLSLLFWQATLCYISYAPRPVTGVFLMSKDGLLPSFFRRSPKVKTPYKSNLLFMVFVSLFAAFVPARVVGEMVSIGTLLAFVWSAPQCG